MSKPEADRILHRIRRIQGQAAALEKQHVHGSDLVSLLQQIAALRGALTGLSASLIERSLDASLAAMRPGSPVHGGVHEVVQATRTYMR